MKRLHVHVSAPDLAAAVGFYSGLFDAPPCCAGATCANWCVDDPAVNFAASTGDGPQGRDACVAHEKSCCVPEIAPAPAACGCLAS